MRQEMESTLIAWHFLLAINFTMVKKVEMAIYLLSHTYMYECTNLAVVALTINEEPAK